MSRKPSKDRAIASLETKGHNPNSEKGKKAFLREAKIMAWARDRYGGDFGVAARIAEYHCRKILSESEDTEAREWASEVLDQIAWTKHWTKQATADGGNSFTDLATASAFQAGMGWALAKMKMEWEAHAIRGESVAAGYKAAAAETNSKHGPLREQRFALMRKLVPEIGVDSAASACEAAGLGTHAAIKKQWNRHVKK